MKVSLSWLREFTALPPTTAELVDLLTLAGVEVEGVEQRGADFPKVVVAQILESLQHPNADRLSVCKVDAGTGEPVQIVCGAKNYRVGDKVPLALPGAVLPGDFKIKVGKLRGVDSYGMMCSAKELGLGEGHEGLLILPATAPVGAPVSELFPRTSSSTSRSRPTAPTSFPITASLARSPRCEARPSSLRPLSTPARSMPAAVASRSTLQTCAPSTPRAASVASRSAPALIGSARALKPSASAPSTTSSTSPIT